MQRVSSSWLRGRLVLLVLLAVGPAMLLVFTQSRQQKDILEREVKSNALRLARLVSIDHERLIDGARQLLGGLAEVREVRRSESGACDRLMAGIRSDNAVYANLGVVEPDGVIGCSALALAEPVSVADRGWFRDALTTRRFSVGEYQISRVTGRPSLNVAQPVVERGRVRRVVYAALDLELLNAVAARIELTGNSVLNVVDAKGTILVRYPDPASWVGKRFPDSPLVRAIQTSDEGTTAVAGFDGVERLWGYVRLTEPDDATGAVFVGIGTPRRAAFAEVDRIARLSLIGLAAVGLIALAVAWLIGNAMLVAPVTRQIDLHSDRAEALTELDKMKNAFLAAASHDLRSPLAALRGFAEILAGSSDRLTPEQRQQLAERIVANAERMERLLGSLLDVQRLARGEAEAVRRTISVRAAVEGALADVDPAGRPLSLDVPEMQANLDPVQFERIVENLASNAVRHTQPGTPIWVRARRDADALVLVVEDAGRGVIADERDAVFQPFQRGSDAELRPGMGLGLHLVAAFAGLHGGRAWVEERPGGGACFTVVLPDAFEPAS